MSKTADIDAIAERFAPVPARAQAKSERLPIKALDDRGRKLVDLMTFGLDDADEAERRGLPANTPLTLEQASELAGLKRRNAHFLFSQKVFLQAYSENLAALKKSKQARAVATLADIAFDPGDETAATKTVRVKAANALLDNGEARAAPVNVNVGVGVNLQPGIVIRLPANVPKTPLEGGEQPANTIDTHPLTRDQRMITRAESQEDEQ